MKRPAPSHGLLAALLLFACYAGASAQQASDARPDPLAPLARFVGHWEGSSTGQSGAGQVTRSYAPIMRGRYLLEENLSRYPAQAANKPGELHEHRAIFSYDRARKTIVLRQFHVEGFVNTYRPLSAPGEQPMVFESESFENFDHSWKARESYEFSADGDAFVETFELAPPGKPYEVYSRNQLRRSAAR